MRIIIFVVGSYIQVEAEAYRGFCSHRGFDHVECTSTLQTAITLISLSIETHYHLLKTEYRLLKLVKNRILKLITDS